MTKKLKAQITICALSIPLSASAALVPALASIGRAFPEWEGWIQYLITIPPLTMIISSLATNRMLSWISMKKITIFSILLIIFSGVTPFGTNSFIYLLFTRVVMGLGIGILNTVVSSLPVVYFKYGKERDNATGLQAAFISAGSIVFSLLSGWLASIHWQRVFLTQIINIIPLIVVMIIMPSNAEIAKPDKITKKQLFVKEAFSVTLLSFVCILITCTYPLNLSLFVEKNGLGNSELVGMLVSINSVIGFVIGIVFVKIMEHFKKLTLSLGLIIAGVAFFVVSLAQTNAVLLIGSMLFGIGTSVVSPALFARLYEKVPTNLIVPAVSMLGVGSNLSQFVSPFIINPIATIFGNGEIIRFFVAGTLIIVIAVILLLNDKNKLRRVINE